MKDKKEDFNEEEYEDEYEDRKYTSKNSELSQCNILGGLTGLFFALFGLFAGFLYPAQSKERRAFIKGWIVGFVSLIIIVVFILLIVLIAKGISNGLEKSYIVKNSLMGIINFA